MIPLWLWHMLELFLVIWMVLLVIWGGRQYHELRRLRRRAAAAYYYSLRSDKEKPSPPS